LRPLSALFGSHFSGLEETRSSADAAKVVPIAVPPEETASRAPPPEAAA
jgi:hypothetical protein